MLLFNVSLSYVVLALITFLFSLHCYADEPFQINKKALLPENVAVIVNTLDANSVEVGNYYIAARQIPKINLIQVSLEKSRATLNEAEFALLKSDIDAKITANIDVIVLAWSSPYAVNCNSITGAITLGYQGALCQNTCSPSIQNPYFNSVSKSPFKDLNLRLSILLPTDSVDLAKAVIDRGVLSAFSVNDATGYFLKTTDKDRSKPREQFFPRDLFAIKAKKLFLRTLNKNSIKDKKDIMFYFTGVDSVPFLETLNFMPGAIADHLTSFGGILQNSPQMSSIKWLEAGATGTYGTVSEPCNYWQKFPNPKVLLSHYLAGETLVESYWKSVYWPSQGLFIGEPLAAPYNINLNQ